MAAGTAGTTRARARRRVPHLAETKHAFKTTEFAAMVAVIAGILIAAAVIDGGRGSDTFVADQAWLYVAIVAVGYMVSRGLAKSGTYEPSWEEDGGNRDFDGGR